MSGKRVPGQVWRKLGPSPGGGKGGSGGRADDRVAALMEQYRQMLRFLGEKGCLLNSVRPEVQLKLLVLRVSSCFELYDPLPRSVIVPVKPRKKLQGAHTTQN